MHRENLGFFFTVGMSLRAWEKGGMLDREIVLYNELAKHFRRIYFFSYGGREELQYRADLAENITIVPAPCWIPSMLYSFLLPGIQWRVVRQCHVLKTNQMLGSWTALIAKLLFGGRLVVRNGHSWSLQARDKGVSLVRSMMMWFVENLCYSLADRVIISFKEGVDYIARKYGIARSKIAYIPNFVDVRKFAPVKGAPKKSAMIFVGRLVPQKNLPALIAALKNTKFSLDIVGDGPLRMSLEREARRQGVLVNFLGIVPHSDLPAVLRKYPVFVLPSKYECMPKTLLEAMSCGCAVIGTTVRGIREVIDDGVDGILCATDSRSIRRAILSLMSNRRMRMRLGRAARKKVKDAFGLSLIVRQELSVLL